MKKVLLGFVLSKFLVCLSYPIYSSGMKKCVEISPDGVARYECYEKTWQAPVVRVLEYNPFAELYYKYLYYK